MARQNESQGFEALGAGQVIPITQPPPGSVKQSGPRAGSRAGMSVRTCGRHDEQYGQRVYVALGYSWDTESAEARREICSFASVWHRTCEQLSGLPPPMVDELGLRGIDEARKIARRKRAKNKGAVWIDVFKKIAAKRKSEVKVVVAGAG